jgi:hypothetical protein
MREVKQGLTEAQRAQSREKPFQVSAIVMSNPQENLYYGTDLEAWIKEGLVDTIIPYSSREGLDSSSDSWTDPRDAEFFLRITKGTPCKLALNIMPRQISPKEYQRRASALYEAGVEYLFFWDIDQRNDFGASWQTLRDLGHRGRLKDWVRRGAPDVERPYCRLLKLGDWDLSYGTPG